MSSTEAIGIMDMMSTGAFWVLFTMVAFLLSLVFQGYWTHWAHTRLDGLRKEVEDLKGECDAMKEQMRSMKDESPFPWIKKVKP